MSRKNIPLVLKLKWPEVIYEVVQYYNDYRKAMPDKEFLFTWINGKMMTMVKWMANAYKS